MDKEQVIDWIRRQIVNCHKARSEVYMEIEAQLKEPVRVHQYITALQRKAMICSTEIVTYKSVLDFLEKE